jgi:hypothetical protein
MLESGVQRYLASTRSDQQSLSVGVRWDARRNLCLKTQVDVISTRNHANTLWWHPSSTWNGHATVASLTLDFTF